MQLRTNCMTKVESAAAPNQRFLTKWKLHDCGLYPPPPPKKKEKPQKCFLFSQTSVAPDLVSQPEIKTSESGKLPFDSHADVNRMRQKHSSPITVCFRSAYSGSAVRDMSSPCSVPDFPLCVRVKPV
ncbi:hypothetical protein FQA47_001624 [Oryzias melastigma]|uniref:Uncharacterized protein n=1 Tax=Oryzias melastigma TaxID=30732 RepID=A0A834C5Z7_ORYME|nr:hypothetical protein FQA47_001624 [Oryzias melastigma]